MGHLEIRNINRNLKMNTQVNILTGQSCPSNGQNLFTYLYVIIRWQHSKPSPYLPICSLVLNNGFLSWLVWLSGLISGLWTKGSPNRFPIRAHAWIVGQVSRGGHTRGNHTLIFLSLSFSFLSSSLKINK